MDIIENYFDHDADIGIIGRGQTIEESFVNGAKAMFALMGNLTSVDPKKVYTFTFIESDIEFAFVTWLNLLLAEANARNYFFSEFQISRDENQWRGQAFGEPWRENMERGTDVKGATLTMLSVKEINHQWEARCVVDV